MSRSNRKPLLTLNEDIGEDTYKHGQSLSNTIKAEKENKFWALLGTSAFFTYFITPRTVGQFLGQTFGLILLPLMAASSALNIALKWKEYVHERAILGKNPAWLSKAVESLIDVGIIIAAIGSIFAQAAFAIAAPAIIVAAVGIQSLVQLGMAISDFVKLATLRKTETSSDVTIARKNELWRDGWKHLANSVVNAVMGTAIGLMAFAGWAAMAYMGLAASVVGAAVVNKFQGGDAKLAIVDVVEPEPVASSDNVYDGTSSNTATVLNSLHGMDLGRNIRHATYDQTGNAYSADVIPLENSATTTDNTYAGTPMNDKFTLNRKSGHSNVNVTHIESGDYEPLSNRRLRK
jgi:hypothetical protein